MPNRLIHTTSPYLRQHAEQPVDWWPWGPEALDLARREDRPILLSIGYSACHWCHVMAHESFDDPDTATLMNRLFVNIKVDREERPDLDRIYQTAHQWLNRRAGGWPLTLFLTPDDQAPFFAGTYFPRKPRHGLPAFGELLTRVEAVYREQGPAIRRQNQALVEALDAFAPRPDLVAGEPDGGPLDRALDELAAAFDARDGGFGGAPKFPQPGLLTFLLGRWADAPTQHPQALAMARLTLERMIRGGIRDQLGGGFYRYAVDAGWMIPHFEKMLYDNGPLLGLCCDLWQATGDPVFREAANTTADWVIREMQAPTGGYYASLDADTDGKEGWFYLWEPIQLRLILAPEDFDLMAAVYGLAGPPNFEERWHLREVQTPQALALARGLDPDQVAARLAQARRDLLALRSARRRPFRDEKCLTAWNALMIKGMARAGRVLGRPDYQASARRALEFLRTSLWSGDRLLASYKDGQAQLPAYLDDHAFLLDALLESLQGDWDSRDLAWAVALAEALLDRFADPVGGFFFTARDQERLLYRPKPLGDDATPSGNGIAIRALGRLGHLLGETRYLEAAEQGLRLAWPALRQFPAAHATLLEALAEWLDPPEILVVRAPAAELPAWRAQLPAAYAPRRWTLLIPSEETELPGLLAQRTPRAGGLAYLCRGTQCLTPIGDPTALGRALGQTGSGAVAG